MNRVHILIDIIIFPVFFSLLFSLFLLFLFKIQWVFS